MTESTARGFNASSKQIGNHPLFGLAFDFRFRPNPWITGKGVSRGTTQVPSKVLSPGHACYGIQKGEKWTDVSH